METFEKRVASLRAIDRDEYAYHSDLRRALREALEIIDGLMEVQKDV